MAIVVAACGQRIASGPPTSVMPSSVAPPSEAPATADPDTPVAGGTLVVALPGDIDTLDPAFIDDSLTSYVVHQVMEGLVRLKPGSTTDVEPAIAESWDVSDDGLTYTFTIRTGSTFHDGTPVDAEAVRHNFDRWLNRLPQELQARADSAGALFEGFGDASNVASVEAPDPTTFIVALKEARSNFVPALATAPFTISSPTALEAGNANDPDRSENDYWERAGLFGTGPFVLEEWVRGDHVSIVRNPAYLGPQERPWLDRVVFRPYPDLMAGLVALRAGEVDLAHSVAVADVASLADDAELLVIDRGGSCSVAQLALNHAFDPVSDPIIREAIAYALDTQGYVDTFYAGDAAIADNWLPPSTSYHEPTGLPTYDPTRAMERIQEANLDATGDALTIDLWYPSDVARPYLPDPEGLFEAISGDLEAVGFTVNPNTAAWDPDYLDAASAGAYEASLTGWTCHRPTVDDVLQRELFGYRDGAPNSAYQYANVELDDVIGQALSATDDAQIADLWSQAQSIVRGDLPTIPLIHTTQPGAVRDTVKGLVASGSLTEYLNSVWIVE